MRDYLIIHIKPNEQTETPKEPDLTLKGLSILWGTKRGQIASGTEPERGPQKLWGFENIFIVKWSLIINLNKRVTMNHIVSILGSTVVF